LKEAARSSAMGGCWTDAARKALHDWFLDGPCHAAPAGAADSISRATYEEDKT